MPHDTACKTILFTALALVLFKVIYIVKEMPLCNLTRSDSSVQAKYFSSNEIVILNIYIIHKPIFETFF